MVCKLCIFQTQWETWKVIIFEGFFGFYIDRKFLCNSFLWVSKLYELSFWFRRSPEAQALIYIWDHLALLFMESSIRTICTYSDFFCSVDCTSLICKLCLLFQTILDLRVVLTLEVFSSEILRRVSFNP